MSQAELAQLTVAEKFELMERLWDDLCGEADLDAVMPAWHADELAQRLARLDAGTEAISPWPEAKERILQAIRKH